MIILQDEGGILKIPCPGKSISYSGTQQQITVVKLQSISKNHEGMHVVIQMSTRDQTAFLLPYDADQYQNEKISVLFLKSYNVQYR